VAAETRSPYLYDARTNYVSSGDPYTWESLQYGENKGQTYGWGTDFGAVIEDQLPTQVQVWPWANYSGHSGAYVEVGYLTTNYVWALVYDEASPTNVPVIEIGADPFVDNSYFTTEPPPLHYTVEGTTPPPYVVDTTKVYWRTCETRILHSALVVDWDFKIFNTTDYVPEAYTPAWVTNGIPPWSTNSP
jgi:hypothetical protein